MYSVFFYVSVRVVLTNASLILPVTHKAFTSATLPADTCSKTTARGTGYEYGVSLTTSYTSDQLVYFAEKTCLSDASKDQAIYYQIFRFAYVCVLCLNQ